MTNTTLRVNTDTLAKLYRVQGWVNWKRMKRHTLGEIVDLLCQEKLDSIKEGEKDG